MPYTGVPLCSSAISVPQIGNPAMKDLVPSIGSSTQTYSASSRSLPNSSPTMPCWGKLALISRRITASAARSASVTGSKSCATLLLSIESEVRKNGRMVSPEEVAKPPDEGFEIDDRHGSPYGRRRGWKAVSAIPLAQTARQRTGRKTLFPLRCAIGPARARLSFRISFAWRAIFGKPASSRSRDLWGLVTIWQRP